MAEAGQKDQTGNEAVAVEDTTPDTFEEMTGFSNGAEDTGSKPAISQPEDKPAVQEPQTAAPAAPTEAAAESTSKKPATTQPPVQNAAEEETEKAAKARSKFLDNEWQEMLLRQAWQKNEIDPELKKVISNITQDKDGKINFDTGNGKFQWGKTADGTEYIGMKGLFSPLTEESATGMAAVAKSRGWESVKVYGFKGNKEKLWLEAKRAGLEVSNFMPAEDSNVYKIWQQESAEKLTGLKNTYEAPKSEAPKAEEPKAAEPPKAEEPKAAEPPKAEEPKAAEPPKAEEPKAAEPPKAEEPKAEEPKAAEPPKAEEPKAAEPPKAEAPVAPVASKFGTAEPPKAEEPKANAAHADWEAKRPSAPQDGEAPWRHEERMKYEAVEGMSKRAATVQDPTHRAGIEKLQDAIKSGKVSVDGPVEREIINNVDSPKGFQKAAEYFGKKADSDLGLPKADTPTVADNTAPKNTAPKNKGPV